MSENFWGPYPPKRKWQFWVGIHGIEFGDRETGKSHTQIGFVWVVLVGYGVYELVKHL